MSFSIKIKDGDVELRGNTVAIVEGTAKLEQDLSTWLRERYRSDRFHTNYGSVLDNYIGGVVSDSVLYEIESEVSRVLLNYQSLQKRKFQESPQSLSPSEILAEVNDITATANYDSVSVSVEFTTYRGTFGSLEVDVDV